MKGRHNLTADQKAHWDSILGKRKVKNTPQKTKTGYDVFAKKYGDKLLDKEIYYLGNCIFWLKEFQEGRTSKDRVKETTAAIRGLVADIENKIKK